MPTYDYECNGCGHKFELFQSITAPVVKKCPSCGKLKVRRLIGIGAGIIFKGSGFYQTDYRSDSYRQAAKKDTGSTSTASPTSSTPSTTSTSSESPASTGSESKSAGLDTKASSSSSGSGKKHKK